ncbi:MAG TPA: serine/threonine-protein kinase, partial [Gemmataceae bacterium]|nr:serine/threonine-protein kinase [Gemmataceae bacterium]
MGSPAVKAHVRRLNDFIERYEQAQARDGQADPAHFLPAPDDPLYLPALRELVRLDLEYGWQRGSPRSLDEYLQRFPLLLQDTDSRAEIAFEDYRLRCQAGQQPSPADYQARYGVNTVGWPVATERRTSDAIPPSSRRGYSSQRRPKPDRVHRSQTTEQMAAALSALPEVGTRFLTFRLVAELGRGTFGRVYLAEQADLAGRPVALKVSTDLYDESQALAQLQHTHIVPIHSVHRCPPFQAVCMPYFGSTTLAHVLRNVRGRPTLPCSGRELVSTLGSARANTSTVPGLGGEVVRRSGGSDNITPPTNHLPSHQPVPAVQEQSLPRARLARLTYVEAVLWMGARLADGLAHAHERGILHLDLKPANVLLTDEGQPMLLDFNLAEDTKLRSSVAAVSVGGTLPYMAPEHLQAFDGNNRKLDGRCDVYSLGVILYELLTGRHPFTVHTGDFKEVLLRMLADRLRPPPGLRHWNPAISPAVESIVQHCLEPRPESRYQSARELQVDLERQLQQQPLRHARETLRERARKWLRRNPRLASAGALLTACAVVLFLLFAALSNRDRRLEAYQSADTFRHFREEARTVQFHILSGRTTDRAELDEGVSRCQALLARYRVLDDPAWQQAPAVRPLSPEDRRRLTEEVGELLLLWARVIVLRAEGEAGERPAAEEALRLNQRAEECYPGSAPRALWRQRAELLRLLNREPEAKAAAFRADRVTVTPHDLSMAAAELSFHGRYADALVRLEEA